MANVSGIVWFVCGIARGSCRFAIGIVGIVWGSRLFRVLSVGWGSRELREHGESLRDRRGLACGVAIGIVGIALAAARLTGAGNSGRIAFVSGIVGGSHMGSH